MIAADPFNFYSGAIADDIIQTVQMCWNLLIMQDTAFNELGLRLLCDIGSQFEFSLTEFSGK